MMKTIQLQHHPVDMETEIYSIAFMVNDNLSISYGEHNTDKEGSTVDQEAESMQASYSMGGMTINLKDSEMTGVAHAAAEIMKLLKY